MRAGCMAPSVRFASSAMSASQYHTTTASPQHAHLGPMALPKGNQQPDLKNAEAAPSGGSDGLLYLLGAAGCALGVVGINQELSLYYTLELPGVARRSRLFSSRLPNAYTSVLEVGDGA